MLTGFAGYSGNRGWGGGGVKEVGETVGCGLWEIRVRGVWLVGFVYGGGGRGFGVVSS